MFGRSALSSTAQEALKITRKSCFEGRDRPTVEAMMLVAGDNAPITDTEFVVCRWPNETALLVAESFFETGAPLTRLRFEHVRSEWAAIAAYGRVQNTLLIWLETLVSGPKYEKAIRYVRQQYGDDAGLNRALDLCREDLDEMTKTGGLEDPLTAYVTSIYLRSILAEPFVSTYFTEKQVDAAARRVSEVLSPQIIKLAGVG